MKAIINLELVTKHLRAALDSERDPQLIGDLSRLLTDASDLLERVKLSTSS